MTTHSVVSFNEPFSLRNVDGVLPPGDYNVYVEDDLIQDRHLSTVLQLPSISFPQGQSRLVSVSASDLERALMKDLRLAV